jgi:hypothetical protein
MTELSLTLQPLEHPLELYLTHLNFRCLNEREVIFRCPPTRCSVGIPFSFQHLATPGLPTVLEHSVLGAMQPTGS